MVDSRLHTELDDAIKLQSFLLPTKKLLKDIHDTMGLDIHYYFHPAHELSGDYIAVKKLTDGRVMLIAADVSGHGIKAALFAFCLHGLLDSTYACDPDPGTVLQALNARMHRLMPPELFTTMAIIIIDTSQNKLYCASAGAPTPALIAHDGTVEWIENRGHLLGVKKQTKYPTQVISYTPGLILLIFSDALIETPDAQGHILKPQELLGLFNPSPSHTMDKAIKRFAKNYLHAVNHKTPDDISIMACRL